MTEDITIKRLHELLDLRDKELEAQRDETEGLRRQLHFGVDWMYQTRGNLAAGLPVPRVELTLVSDGEYSQEYEVVLVNPNRDGTATRVPLGYSKLSGFVPLDLSLLPLEGDVPPEMHDIFPCSFSDLLFHQEKLLVPGFVVYSDAQRYQVELGPPERRWPVKVTAVAPYTAASHG